MNGSSFCLIVYSLIILCVFTISSRRQAILLMTIPYTTSSQRIERCTQEGVRINKYWLTESLTFETIPTSETQIMKLRYEAQLQKQECFSIYFSSKAVYNLSSVHNLNWGNNIYFNHHAREVYITCICTPFHQYILLP